MTDNSSRTKSAPSPLFATRFLIAALAGTVVNMSFALPCLALDGGTLRVNPRNGWLAMEVISERDNPDGDGFDWTMPSTFDGIGAWLADPATLRLQVNHETGDAAISEVNLDVGAFKTAIQNMIDGGTTGGVGFVESARQAYGRWSNNAGASWVDTANTSNTNFQRFCSGQSYAAHTFGADRGFVDEIYITGEEVSGGRLFALDLANRDYYQLSGIVGGATGGIAGMPFDAYENVALIDTGETSHVALLLSPDGGSQRLSLYVGEKGRNANGDPSSDFLSRNGLAYGSYYYLKGALPRTGTFSDGTLDTTPRGALISSKLEDVDTSPSHPHMVVLGDQDSGLFTFDFGLDFSGGGFNAAGSSFSITKVQNHVAGTIGQFGDPDNVEWTAATVLGGTAFDDGLIFVNEDTTNSEIWMMEPGGAGLTIIGDTIGIAQAAETSGIFDISAMLDYHPGSILLTANQGSVSSLTALINPNATPVPEPSTFLLSVGGLVKLWLLRRRWRNT